MCCCATLCCGASLGRLPQVAGWFALGGLGLYIAGVAAKNVAHKIRSSRSGPRPLNKAAYIELHGQEAWDNFQKKEKQTEARPEGCKPFL
jgi:hypothetical protein